MSVVRRTTCAAALLVSFPITGWTQFGSCPQPLPTDAPALGSAVEGVELNADNVDLARAGFSELSGNVVINDGARVFAADAMRFDASRRLLDIGTQSQYRSDDLYVRSDGMRFDARSGRGEFDKPELILPNNSIRAGGSHLTLDEVGTAELSGAYYTTCAPDSEAWSMRAAEIRLDRDAGLGTARHARLHVLGVPVLYLPWVQFPLDDQRRTGVLYPTITSSSRNGVEILWPVYINLAPNYDLQIDPRLISQRGLQLGSRFRYLGEHQTGSVRYEYLGNDSRTGEDRAYGEFIHRGLINDRLSLSVDYSETSDTAYFNDLGSNLDRSALTFLPRQLQLTYNAPSAYTATLLISSFQTLDPTLLQDEKPYRRLPQLGLSTMTPGAIFATRAGMQAEYVNFDGDNVVDGQRMHLNPYLRSYIDRNAWFAGARLDLRHTRYELRNAAGMQSATPTRTVPSVSAEAGLRFERRTAGGNLQTLEPRGFYLYTPFREQSDIPLFDSGEPDFDIVQLFSTNRFSGIDRIADANHIAGAVTTRLLDTETGSVRWSATFGQLLRFDRSRVALDGTTTGNTTSTSEPDGSADSGATDFIAAYDYRLSRRVRASVSTLWSPENDRFARTITRLRYRDGNRRAYVAYRYRRDQLEQADVAVAWPLRGNLSAVGRWRNSLRDSQTLETSAGIAYENCCWMVNLSYRRYIATIDGDYDAGVQLQFQLKGLGGIGGRELPAILRDDY